MLYVMKTNAKLVSNSKLLHFIFPDLLLPMDGKNTLMYFWNNTSESKSKYLQLIKWSYKMAVRQDVVWDDYLDEGWNSTIPKIIDNAIILA